MAPQQVGGGQFKSSNGFAFAGTFTLPAGVNSVKLLVKEIGSWANGTGSSNGTNQESSTTVTRPTSGCAPPPPQCPSAANAQVSSSSNIDIANGTATVSFTVAAGCAEIKLSLVSYKAPGPTFDANTADQQTVHDSKTVVLGAGNHTLNVAVPNCYYQVDFVYGDVIAKLGPAGSSNFYSAQGRLIKARNGGTGSCTPPPTDECPNIAGNQATVPAGMIKEANGTCATPPPPPPPTEPLPPVETTPLATLAAVTPAVVPSPAAAKPAPKAKVKVEEEGQGQEEGRQEEEKEGHRQAAADGEDSEATCASVHSLAPCWLRRWGWLWPAPPPPPRAARRS